MANTNNSFFDALQKLFSASVIIKGKDKTKIRTIDINKLQTIPNLETNIRNKRYLNLEKCHRAPGKTLWPSCQHLIS